MIFGLFDPKTLQDLDSVCESRMAAGFYQEAARIAFKFRDFSLKAKCFDETEKISRVANSYYWICKSALKQLEDARDQFFSDLLLSFFGSYKMGLYCFQKILMNKEFEWDKKHPLYQRCNELNSMYDYVYKNYDIESVERADFEANKIVEI